MDPFKILRRFLRHGLRDAGHQLLQSLTEDGYSLLRRGCRTSFRSFEFPFGYKELQSQLGLGVLQWGEEKDCLAYPPYNILTASYGCLIARSTRIPSRRPKSLTRH